MTKFFPVGASSRHAKERTFERSKLTCGEVDVMLAKKQFYWAVNPVPGRCRFALLFDVLSQSYLVAVVAPETNCVKTLLTLEQFERTVTTVSQAAKMLAHLALLSECSPAAKVAAPEPAPRPEQVVPAWRFVASGNNGERWELPVLSHQEVCDLFCFSMPVGRASELRRRAGRIVVLRSFLNWFMAALTTFDIPMDSVARLSVESLFPEEAAPRFGVDVTEALARVLTAGTQKEHDAAEAYARREASCARQADQRKRLNERKRMKQHQKQQQRNCGNNWTVMCV